MTKTDRIKSKIYHLLQKTESNGASRAEAESALAKASELMNQHYLSLHDVQEPFKDEVCKDRKAERFKSGYDVTLFLNSLTLLFDCEYYYTRTLVVFFGFEQDTAMCEYFYNYILKAMMNDGKQFKKSEDYAYGLELGISGRSIMASFYVGFQRQISLRMTDLLLERESKIGRETGLVVQNKLMKVGHAFSEQGLKLRTISKRPIVRDKVGLKEGERAANRVNLNNGIDTAQKQNKHITVE